MPVQKGTTYATGNQVTATNLNNLVDNATFTSAAVDGVTTQLSGTAIIVKDLGISPGKLSTGGPTWTAGGNLGIGTASARDKMEINASGPGILLSNTAGAANAKNFYVNSISGAFTVNWANDAFNSFLPLLKIDPVGALTFSGYGAGTLVTSSSGVVTAANAATMRTNIGATTVGGNMFTLTNPSAVRFIRLNADNTVSALSDSDFRTAIGAGSGGGTIGGSTGATTERILVADGTGGSTLKATGITIDASNNVTGGTTYDAGTGGYKVSGTKVLGAQAAAEANIALGTSTIGADTVDSVTLDANFTSLNTKINAILAKLRTHGIIAT